jgi:hypothetical protein
MTQSGIEKTRKESIRLLKELSSEQGFLASLEDTANYRRVWSRDGVIAGLAALVVGDEELIETFRLTLHTMREYQSETGQIPNNVSCSTNEANYGMSVGTIDATIWYVIGVCQLSMQTSDNAFFEEMRPSLDRALFYLRCLELNGRGLIYIPQSADWADEYINHGYVLLDEVLYYLALRDFAAIAGDVEIEKKKDKLAEMIRINYFPVKENVNSQYVYNELLFSEGVKKYKPPFPAAYFSNHSIRFHIDNFANSLMLLSGIEDKEKEQSIQKEIADRFVKEEFPIIPAFNPVITEKDKNWAHLKQDYRFSFKNKPYHFHNGGLWPMVHGFFLASLTGTEAKKHLESFSKVLARDNYSFPEYYHGKTYEAEGTRSLAFSASGYLIAYSSIIEGTAPFLPHKILFK